MSVLSKDYIAIYKQWCCHNMVPILGACTEQGPSYLQLSGQEIERAGLTLTMSDT